jgi:hypothetical protein
MLLITEPGAPKKSGERVAHAQLNGVHWHRCSRCATQALVAAQADDKARGQQAVTATRAAQKPGGTWRLKWKWMSKGVCIKKGNGKE